MHFNGNGKVGAGFEKTVHPKFGVALQAEEINLHGVHESVDKSSLRQSLVEGDDIDECKRVHVRDLGWFETERSHLGKKRWHLNRGSAKFDDAEAIEQCSGEMRPHAGLAQVAERRGERGIARALFAEITGKPFDGFGNLLGGGLRCGSLLGLRNLVFYIGIEVAENSCGLGGLMQDVATAKAGQVVGRVVKAKLMNCVLGTEQLELSFLELGVHLQNRDLMLWILIRGHRRTYS